MIGLVGHTGSRVNPVNMTFTKRMIRLSSRVSSKLCYYDHTDFLIFNLIFINSFFSTELSSIGCSNVFIKQWFVGVFYKP